jgi:hypothetical protein
MQPRLPVSVGSGSQGIPNRKPIAGTAPVHVLHPVLPEQHGTARTGMNGNSAGFDRRPLPGKGIRHSPVHYPNLPVQCLNLRYSGNISLILPTS